MEKEVKNQRAHRAPEPDFLLQWGNRKRLRCVKVRQGSGGGGVEKSDGRRRFTPRVFRVEKQSLPYPDLIHRKSESGGGKKRKLHPSPSPEKEDRFYTTRGSLVEKEKEKGSGEGEEKAGMGLPRFFVSLSIKEKEEDFMAMKGCKLPQRPKKRAKFIQKNILLVCPGAWLSDLSQERYQVREKKSSRERRGLKALCMESNSDRE